MISYVDGSFTVNTAPLTITATNRSKTYGATYTPNHDRVHDFRQRAAHQRLVCLTLREQRCVIRRLTSAGHRIRITPSAATGTGLSNYTINYIDGSFTVNTATLTITATNRARLTVQRIRLIPTYPRLIFGQRIGQQRYGDFDFADQRGLCEHGAVAGSPYTITRAGVGDRARQLHDQLR